jgi:hypothetical protein
MRAATQESTCVETYLKKLLISSSIFVSVEISNLIKLPFFLKKPDIIFSVKQKPI